jgi:hypothetical protein
MCACTVVHGPEEPFHYTEIENYRGSTAIPEKELRGLSPNFHIYVSVSDLYIYSQNRSTYFLAVGAAF